MCWFEHTGFASKRTNLSPFGESSAEPAYERTNTKKRRLRNQKSKKHTGQAPAPASTAPVQAPAPASAASVVSQTQPVAVNPIAAMDSKEDVKDDVPTSSLAGLKVRVVDKAQLKRDKLRNFMNHLLRAKLPKDYLKKQKNTFNELAKSATQMVSAEMELGKDPDIIKVVRRVMRGMAPNSSSLSRLHNVSMHDLKQMRLHAGLSLPTLGYS